jgi:hypothetical protein
VNLGLEPQRAQSLDYEVAHAQMLGASDRVRLAGNDFDVMHCAARAELLGRRRLGQWRGRQVARDTGQAGDQWQKQSQHGRSNPVR